MVELKHAIGRRIRQLRKARRSTAGRRAKSMTIGELAEAAGLSVDYVNKLELGQHMPTAETLRRIALALEVTVGELFPEQPTATQQRSSVDELAHYAARFPEKDVKLLLQIAKLVLERE